MHIEDGPFTNDCAHSEAAKQTEDAKVNKKKSLLSHRSKHDRNCRKKNGWNERAHEMHVAAWIDHIGNT